MKALGALLLGMLFGFALFAIADTCQDLTSGLRREATKCLTKKDYLARLECVKYSGDTLPFSDDDWKSCQTATKSLAAEMVTQENQLYPNQKLAFIDGTNFSGSIPSVTIGGDSSKKETTSQRLDNADDLSREPANDCSALIGNLTKQSEDCLDMPLDSAREACGTKAIDYAHANGYSRCQRQVDSLREQFIQREKKKYSNSVL